MQAASELGSLPSLNRDFQHWQRLAQENLGASVASPVVQLHAEDVCRTPAALVAVRTPDAGRKPAARTAVVIVPGGAAVVAEASAEQEQLDSTVERSAQTNLQLVHHPLRLCLSLQVSTVAVG